MKRNLLFLNLLLMAAIALVVWRLKTGYDEEFSRETAFLARTVQAQPPPVVVIPPPPGQVSAASFLEIATKLLFNRDRNPMVVVEAVKPPPEPVMPPLPRYYGMISFGKEPRVVLGLPGGAQHSYLAGAELGEFTLTRIAADGLEFEWKGKKVEATYAELRDTGPPPQQAAAAPAAVAATPGGGLKNLTAAPERREGPDLSGTKTCDSSDTAPAGTVRDGYRKLVTDTPFAKVCRWEKVN